MSEVFKDTISKLNQLLESIDTPPDIAEVISKLVYIGFSVKRVFKPTSWRYATKMLDRACELDLAYPYDFGRGKGKYKCQEGIRIDDIVKTLQNDDIAIHIATEYLKSMDRLKRRQENQI